MIDINVKPTPCARRTTRPDMSHMEVVSIHTEKTAAVHDKCQTYQNGCIY